MTAARGVRPGWTKRGRIWAPERHAPWAQTHAMAPTPFLRAPSALRLYVGFCDAEMVSRVGWVDVDADDPARVLGVAETPALDIGEPGAFDDNGVVPTAVVTGADRVLLYYAGFQKGVKAAYTIFTGLAESRDGGATFARRQRTPVLERTDEEPLWRTAAHVVADEGGFRCWYAGGSAWAKLGAKSVPRLDIRVVESTDGVRWERPATVCLAVDDRSEVSLGRPWVVRAADGYTMYYSARGGSSPYRLRAATSPDGRAWTAAPGAPGLDLGPDDWDAQMMYASSTFARGEREYLFYNGNDTGATGFGWAERTAP